MGEKKSEEVPERCSAQKETEIVLLLLRGEALDEVSRKVQVPGGGAGPRHTAARGQQVSGTSLKLSPQPVPLPWSPNTPIDPTHLSKAAATRTRP